MYETWFYNMGLVFSNTQNFPLQGTYLFFKRVGKLMNFFSHHSPQMSLGSLVFIPL